MQTMVDKQSLRAEIEATHTAYHHLLVSLSDTDWTRRSGNPDMTVKELMWHVAWAMSWMAGSIDAVKAGKPLRVPSFLIEPGRKFAMRWLARRATPETARQKYDEGHAALLARLDSIGDDEWHREASRFGEVRTVEWYFAHAREHFEEHARDVRAALATTGAAMS